MGDTCLAPSCPTSPDLGERFETLKRCCVRVYTEHKRTSMDLGEPLASLPHGQHEASTALIQRLLLYQQKLKTTLKI